MGPAASQRTANQLTGPIAAITNTAATSARGDFSMQSFSRNQVGPRLQHPRGQHEHDHVAERDDAARTLLDVFRDEQLIDADGDNPAADGEAVTRGDQRQLFRDPHAPAHAS